MTPRGIRTGSLAGPLGLWAPPVVWAGAIYGLSSLPGGTVPSRVPDKLVHAILYAILSALACRAIAGGLDRPMRLGAAVLGAACSVAYGVTDEAHQMFVPGRFAEPGDLIADAAGASAAAAGLLAATRRRRERLPVVTLYTRGNCPLCDEAKSVLERERRDRPFELEIRDVDSDPALAERWGEQVPVVFVAGRKAFKFRVDPGRLRRRLDAAGASKAG